MYELIIFIAATSGILAGIILIAVDRRIAHNIDRHVHIALGEPVDEPADRPPIPIFDDPETT